MSEKSINFHDKNIKKNHFYKNKSNRIFNIDYIDVNKILVSRKEPYGKNISLIYFIGYNDNEIIGPLWSQMTGYINEVNNKNENKNKNTITCLLGLKINNL